MNSRRYFLTGAFFLILAIAAFAAAAAWYLLPSFVNVLMMLVGLFSMGALSAFYRLMDGYRGAPIVNITFNEQLARTQLETAAKSLPPNAIDAEFVEVPEDPWDLNASDLLGRDNPLAVAKLRIDLERELRRIAARVGLEKDVHRYGLRRLANELAKRQAIDPALVSVIDDILPAANEAIHGGQVSQETAAAILDLGRDLIQILRQQDKRVASRG